MKNEWYRIRRALRKAGQAFFPTQNDKNYFTENRNRFLRWLVQI
jgi:hypothetical protein